MTPTALSYGAGVHSTALIALIHLGFLPRPDLILYNDVGAEHPRTIAYLADNHQAISDAGSEFYTWTPGQHPSDPQEPLYDEQMFSGKIRIPARFRRTRTRCRRQCTVDWKVKPSHRALRRHSLTDWTLWLGIAADEAHRSAHTPHNPAWLTIRRPLVELGIDKAECKRIILEAGLPVPPKSGCWFCPFQRVDTWTQLHQEHPDLYTRAQALEDHLNTFRPGDEIDIIPPTAKKQVATAASAINL